MLLRPLRALLVGALLTLGAAELVASLLPDSRWPATTHLWVADRDAGRVIALDEGLYEARAARFTAPVLVASKPDAGAWVVDAVGRGPRGAHRLVQLDLRGAEMCALDLDAAPLGLCSTEAGQALVCLPGRILRVSGEGVVDRDLREDGARCIAVRQERLLVGFDDGRARLFELDRDGVLIAQLDLGAPVVALAAGHGGGWWALDGGSPQQVHRLTPELTLAWDQATGIDGSLLSAVPDSEAAWIVSGTRSGARRIGSHGVLEIGVNDLPLGGIQLSQARRGGGLALAAPGAVLVLDGAGRLARTQGGFDFLTCLSLAPGS